MNNFNTFIQTVLDCINRQNAPRLQALISLDSPDASAAVMAARAANPRWSPAAAFNRLPDGWAEFIALHCAALAALQDGTRAEAYAHVVASLTPFLKVFREEESAWVVGPMGVVTRNLRAAAEAADAEARAAGKRVTRLEECGDQLRRCFSLALQAPGNRDKRAAALDLVNLSIKIYFKLNTLRLCKNLIRTVDSRQFPPFESFPVSQRVTYKFYVGRLAVFDDNYEEAEAALSYALKHCHRTADRNRARILKYLVPVAMLLGRVPSPALRAAYPEVLAPYDPLIESMRTGDVGLFASTMAAQQTAFIKDGTYLLLEKLGAAVQRRLLRRVWAIHAAADPGKAAQIPLQWFQDALEALGCGMGMDEVECIAANLIYRKYVKGYISHRQKVMVVAKADPFPALSTVALSDS